MKTETISTALEVVGALIFAAGIGLFSAAAGIAVLGIEMIVFAIALSLDKPAPPAPADEAV